MVSTSKDKGTRKKKGKAAASEGPEPKKPKAEHGCFFYGKLGHVKKECKKYHAWHVKKGTFLTLVCSETNLASVPRNTWWIDSGATTYICVSLQGCLSYRQPSDAERCIYVGDGKTVEVEAIGHFRLLMQTGCYLDLLDTFVVPSFRRNLISVSVLDKSGYSCSFVNRQFSLSINSNVIGTGLLNAYDNLYLLETVSSYNENLHFSSRGLTVVVNSTIDMMVQGEALKTAAYILNRVPTKAAAKTPYELWMGRKPSLKHLHIWGCPAEARPYRPYDRKLDSKAVSSYFVGYAKRSRGFKFYDPSTRSIFETGTATFFEDVEFGGRNPIRNIVFEDEEGSTVAFDNVQVLIPVIDHEVNSDPQPSDNVVQPQNQLEMIEHEDETGVMEDDPINFHQAMQSSNSYKWIEAMNEEYKSMQDNKVWELISLPSGVKPIGCKWIFKTKRDSNGNVERYKERLVAKGFTQKEGIDYKETFSPVSTKDSFRTIMALVAHFDLELHQMDVKTAFLNGDIEEIIYMVQPENFVLGDSKKMVCKLTKSIYGLKQASRQWYFKFHQIIISYGFEANVIDECVYHKFSGSKHIFLVLYVDDILLATNDIGILHDTKSFLSKHFEMKDLGDASCVLGIEIHGDRSRGILGLSQRNYIDKVLKRFGMQNSKPCDTPVAKGDKFSLSQCPKTNLEIQEMEKISYSSAIGSLMYAQVCTCPDIAFIVRMLGRYLSNPGMDHWKAAKRVMRYLQRTKEYMLTYRRSDQLEIIGYSDSDFVGCQDNRRSTSGYTYMLAGGAISWRSVKQTLVASSTMAAEFVACYEASNQGIWLCNFVIGLRILEGVERPLKIFCDNKSVVLYSNNNRSSIKSKHIDIKFLIVKERVQS
ncbi:hypothetical protein KPL71_026134 [Citrus sinensis]|uniref:Uncharacterized protein n=1 Tax=Citrus sinensis TaxID=2711 RepID=A0ACB8HXB0_CITSI|nr:hypothetical protein KPL71_026134 [Citrus sinensis]